MQVKIKNKTITIRHFPCFLWLYVSPCSVALYWKYGKVT